MCNYVNRYVQKSGNFCSPSGSLDYLLPDSIILAHVNGGMKVLKEKLSIPYSVWVEE